MKQEKIWLKKNSYDKKKGSKSPPSYPNEMLIRLCTSKRFSKFPLNIFKKNFKVIEIGCFAGNNLRFFIENEGATTAFFSFLYFQDLFNDSSINDLYSSPPPRPVQQQNAKAYFLIESGKPRPFFLFYLFIIS